MKLEKKIYYHDTDCGGVVYYANYLNYLEEGRNEFCGGRGIDLKDWRARGLAFAVVRIEIEYKAPARYGDTLDIITRVEKVGNASIQIYQEIKRGELLLIRAKVVWACVGEGFKTQPVPEEIRQALG